MTSSRPVEEEKTRINHGRKGHRRDKVRKWKVREREMKRREWGAELTLPAIWGKSFYGLVKGKNKVSRGEGWETSLAAEDPIENTSENKQTGEKSGLAILGRTAAEKKERSRQEILEWTGHIRRGGLSLLRIEKSTGTEGRLCRTKEKKTERPGTTRQSDG